MSMESESYTIKTSSFEGPLALLLSLVEKRKLFINDVSLAEVTDDYINYVNNINVSQPGEISNFILVAATLILIKSKSLLPTLDLSLDEKSDIKDLEDRLRLYELFSKLSLDVKENFGKKIMFAPLDRKSDLLIFLPDDQITKESMMAFAGDVLGRMPKAVYLPEVEVKKVVSIKEMIDSLTERIEKSIRVNFRDFSGASARGAQVVTREEKINVIVSFLAMLELVRNGLLNAIQENSEADIIIEKQIN